MSSGRSESDPVKKATYNKLARTALDSVGGKIIQMGTVGGTLVVPEDGIEKTTILIEFESYDSTVVAYESPYYQKVLAALDNGADRDIRIFNGIQLF